MVLLRCASELFFADRPFDADLLGRMYGDALAIPQRRADRRQDDDTSTEQRGNGCVAKVRDQDGTDGADRNRKNQGRSGRPRGVGRAGIEIVCVRPCLPCVNA